MYQLTYDIISTLTGTLDQRFRKHGTLVSTNSNKKLWEATEAYLSILRTAIATCLPHSAFQTAE